MKGSFQHHQESSCENIIKKFSEENLYEKSLAISVDTRKKSIVYAHFQNEATKMTKAVQNTALTLANRTYRFIKPDTNAQKKDMPEISVEELTKCLMQNEVLWNDFCNILSEANVVTNFGVNEVLQWYIYTRRNKIQLIYDMTCKDESEDNVKNRNRVHSRLRRLSFLSLLNLPKKSDQNTQSTPSSDMTQNKHNARFTCVQRGITDDLRGNNSCFSDTRADNPLPENTLSSRENANIHLQQRLLIGNYHKNSTVLNSSITSSSRHFYNLGCTNT